MKLSEVKDKLAAETYTKGEVLEILGMYEDAILERMAEAKQSREKDYKFLAENNGSEFELGSANGAFWELVSLRAWILAS